MTTPPGPREINEALHQPDARLLAEATGAELFLLRTQLQRWLDLTNQELHSRYPVLAQEDSERCSRLHASWKGDARP
jgi:hypothetical protein